MQTVTEQSRRGSSWTAAECQFAREHLNEQEGKITARVWKTFCQGVLAGRSAGAIRSHMQKSYCGDCHAAYLTYKQTQEAAADGKRKREREDETEVPSAAPVPEAPVFKRVTPLPIPAATKLHWIASQLLTEDTAATTLEQRCRACALNYVEAVSIDGGDPAEAWAKVPAEIRQHVESWECQEKGGLAIARLFVERGGIEMFLQNATERFRAQNK